MNKKMKENYLYVPMTLIKRNKELKLKLSDILIISYLLTYYNNVEIDYNQIFNLLLSNVGLSKNTIKAGLDSLIDKNLIEKYDDNSIYIKRYTYDSQKLKIESKILKSKGFSIFEKFYISYIKSFNSNKKYFLCKNDTISDLFSVSISAVKKANSKFMSLGLIDKKIVKSRGFVKTRSISINNKAINNYVTINNDNRTYNIDNRKVINNINCNNTVNINSISNESLSKLSLDTLKELFFAYKNDLDRIKLYYNSKQQA